jgi:sugar phosphate isomerase/epimerase
MKLSFMTLGCPGWDLDTICRRGREYGFDGVDFRGYLDQMDITTLPLFSTQGVATRRTLNDSGLEICCISSSIEVCNREARVRSLEEARRTVQAARTLGVTNVRIFGGGDGQKHTRAELARVGCDTIEEILALDGARDLHWLFETHDLWLKAADCKLLLDNIRSPSFGALWDMGHTYRVGRDTPETTYAGIGDRVGYCHVKDAVHDSKHPKAMEDGWHYVLPGTGELPLAKSIGILKAHGYDGWLAYEHEKRWHPELDEPEVAFPAFVRWARALL